MVADPQAGQSHAAAAELDLESPVFVIGAPRSGTTWLQRLLATPPQIVSGQETNLFDKYIEPLDAMFARQVRQLRTLPRVKGLPTLLSQDYFDGLMRTLVQQTYAELGRRKPSATVVVDKNPAHTLHVPRIRRLLPRARFVHIVRDGRDVAASMVAASSGWGSYWAPSRVAAAADWWRVHVVAARQAGYDDGSFLEISYEDLRAHGPATLRRVFDFVGVPVSEAEAVDLLARQSRPDEPDPLIWGGEVLTLNDGRPPHEPEGFVRFGGGSGWQQGWSPVDRAGFDAVAGELLVELGYAPDRSWADGPGWARYAHRVQDAGHRARRVLLDGARRAVSPS